MIRRAGREDVDAIAGVFGRSFGSLTFLPQLHTPEEHRAFFARVVAGQDVADKLSLLDLTKKDSGDSAADKIISIDIQENLG